MSRFIQYPLTGQVKEVEYEVALRHIPYGWRFISREDYRKAKCEELIAKFPITVRVLGAR